MPFDDAVRELDDAPDGPTPKVPPPAPDPYEATRKALDDTPEDPARQDQTVPARAAAMASSAYTPDRAADIAHLANRTGLPPDAVDKAYADVVAQRRMDAADYPAIQQNHKQLLQWLSEPVHAAIAQDDLPGLRAVSAAAQSVANVAGPDDPLPFWSGTYRPAVLHAANDFGTWLLAGPAWVQQEVRGLAGIEGAPTRGTPLAMVYGAWDQERETKRVQDTYARSWVDDFAGKAIGAALDPRNIALPLKGAQLAVQGSKVLGEVATAGAAIKGAAAVQGEIAGLGALQQSQEQKQANPDQAAGTLATAANVATQSALGYFFGKSGGMIGPLRSLRETMFGTNPMAELSSDIARQTVIGGAQGMTSAIADQEITQGTAPTTGEAVQAAAVGAASGALLSSLNIHEALIARHHLENLRATAAMQFGNKLGQLFDAAAASKSAQRSPEEVGKLIDSITQGGIHHVYLQADEWTKHFEAKGLDATAEAQKAGLAEEYARAIALKGDMQMPVRAAVGLAMDSENASRLATLFRQDPAAPNVKEAAETIQKVPERLAEVTDAQRTLAASEVAAGRGAEDTNGHLIREEVAAQLVAAGRPAGEADVLGQLHQRVFGNIADLFNREREKLGAKPVSPTDLYDQFKLRIQSFDSSMLDKVASSGALDRLLDRIRTQGPQTPEEFTVRAALKTMGLDVAEHDNAKVHAALAEHAKPTPERPETPPGTGTPIVLRERVIGGDHTDKGLPAYHQDEGVTPLFHRGVELKPGMKMRADSRNLVWFSDKKESYGAGKEGVPTTKIGLPSDKIAIMDEERGGLTKLGKKIIDRTENGSKEEVLAAAEKMGYLAVKRGMDVSMRPETAERFLLAQGEDQPLGTFSIGRDLASIITLYQGANRSTAFHESAHYFLEVMGDLASRADAPQELKDDFSKVMEWSGYGSRENMLANQKELAALQDRIGDGKPTDEERAKLRELATPHEKFARGFEAYLMEGKAPAKPLRSAFARIKAWMKSVYQDIKNLGVEINPEISGVFDRLLASDAEIKASKERVQDTVAFTKAEDGAFTPEQFAAYQRLAVDADRIESEELEKKLLAVERQAASKAYRADKAETKDRVGEQVAQEKVYQALSALQDGKTWDGRTLPDTGVVMKIFRSDVERLLTPEEMARLPGPGKDVNRGKSVMTTGELGLTADDAARMLGYGSGHELLTDLMEAADRERRVDAITDEQMKAKYPDPMDDQKAMDKASGQALHAPDIRGKLLDMEREAVARLAAQKTDGEKTAIKDLREERQGMRVAAREMIAKAKLSTIDPERFAMAERRSAIAFREAMAKQDYATALGEKRRQMMNAELTRAAYDAQERAQGDRDKLQKAAADPKWRQAIAKAGGWEWTVTLPDGTQKVYDTTDERGRSPQEQARTDAINGRGTYERTSGYIDQIDQILERYDLRQRSNGQTRRREALQRWIDRNAFTTQADGSRVPNGLMSMFPPSVMDETSKTSWKSLTVDQLHDVRDAVDAFEAAARSRTRLQGEFAKMEVAAQATEMAAQIERAAIPRIAGDRGILGTIADAGSELVSIPRIAEEMDGHTVGPVQRLLIHPQERALNAEHAMLDEVLHPMVEAEREWGKRNSIGAYVQKKLPGGLRWQRIINGKPVDIKGTMSLRERIMLLGHYGNPEGRQRLIDNHGWGEREVQQVLASLDAKDIAFANKMADARDAKWSDVKAQAEKYNGFAPPRVEAIPVELPAGTYKGGYQRIYYDRDITTTNEQVINDVLSGKDYLRTDRPAFGSAESRADRVTGKVLSLEMSDWRRAAYEMVHALTHQNMLVNNSRLLNHPALKAAIIKHWGNDILRQFRNQADGMASGNKGAFSLWQKAIGALSSNASFASWAFNPAFALPHLSQWPKIAQEVGIGQALDTTVRYLTNPSAMTAEVKAMSPSIKARHEGPTSVGSNIPLVTDTQEGIQKAGMMLVSRLFWESHDVIAFKAAFDQHMAKSGNNREEAIAVANQKVSNIAGSSAQKDIPDVRRNALMKVLTNRMLFDLANYNSIASNVNRIRMGVARGDVGHVAAGVAKILASTIVQGLVWNSVYDLVTGKDMKKEMATWETASGAAQNLAMAAGSSLARCVPVIRDIAGAFMGESHAGSVTGTGFISNVQKAGEYTHDAHKTGIKTAKTIMTAASVLAPLPASEFGKVLDGFKYNSQHPEDDPLRKLWHTIAGPPRPEHR